MEIKDQIGEFGKFYKKEEQYWVMKVIGTREKLDSIEEKLFHLLHKLTLF